ncbi:TPA: lipoprotein bor, partial [Salmonella enterica subsp. enterica serovar Veneziana]|nr:lipoprotein bor [Salmonella enterica subsp. enterica serovar Veneziana]
ISGLGQQKTVDAAAICGSSDKVVRTETQQTFANGLLAFVTLGIYTPLEARVYCSV